MHSRYPTYVAPRSVDSKRTIDISPGLVKLDSLPGVLGRLADRRAVIEAYDALFSLLLII